MSRFGAALAADSDAARAARRAAHGALGRVAGAPDLVVVTAALADPEAADAVAAAVAEQVAATGNDRCAVVGTMAEAVMGETSLGEALEPGQTSVAVWAARLPGGRVRPFRLHSHREARPFEGMSADFPPNGAIAIGGLPEPWPDERAALLFADPYSFPIDGFLARCNTLLPGLPFVGGLAPGPAGYGSARLLLGSEAYATGAVGVLLGGDVHTAIAVSQGCRAIGPAMTVTAAEGDVLLGLAGRPAYGRLLEILRELPEEVREQASTGLHLGIALNEYAEFHDSGDFLIRGVVDVLPERDAIRVGDRVEVGQTVRFQVRDAASAAGQLRAVLRETRRRPGCASIGGALLVSCHGRAAGLFPPPFGAAHDLRTVCAELGTGAVAGFFGTGEIGPVGGRNHLHGYTASVLAFAETE
ncbi:FIST C-terminal domain-containing protein [Actinospica sp. MGRD01-02]|uniref:FIST C-terminal domain-containing protein n=1 Tax=Actinospica acidithermotolerans TaxID=2828514 RepID=A0A941EFD1_9ACTN|nr:FIST N-terminal domain-containing protein [Actinospica acidithermotolerans]MBR7828054.1 FIST C-terminal domain-containing protein [Actinospica acidithermotolerans]